TNDSIYIITEYNYSSTGDYAITATGINGTNQDSESIEIDVEDVETSNLTILNQSSTKTIFEFFITNYLTSALNQVYFSFDPGDNNIINATTNATLDPDESLFVYFEYNYSSPGTYYPNVTSINGTLIDSQNISVTVT
ncbi:MAG: hypothetical protein ABIJ08_05455, partial [Nanoarchaeota archaeon]